MKLDSGTLFAIALACAVTLIQPAIAAPGQNPGQNGQNTVPAPAPLIGASLPGLAIGYGVYWLLRRRRKID